MQLIEIFNKIFDSENFNNAKNAPYSKQNPFYKLFDNDIPRAMRMIVNELQRPLTINYECKGSIGAGVLADTFWFNIMNPNVTRDPQKGVYIVYLVASSGKYIHLCLIQSTGIIDNPAKLDGLKPELLKKSKKIQKALVESTEIQPLDGLGLFNHGAVSLGSSPSLTSQAYEAAVILSKTYEKAVDILDENELRGDLKNMLDIYKRYYSLMQHGKI